jgi:hypothetical protein
MVSAPITIQLQLKYDENAGPVSWGVYHVDSAETIYQDGIGGDDLAPATLLSRLNTIVQTEYEEKIAFTTLQFSNLKQGTYFFQVRDVSESAVKYVKLAELGKEPRVWLELNGSFGGIYSFNFDVNTTHVTLPAHLEELKKDDPTDPPADATDRTNETTTPRLQNITVEILYDDFPAETSWMLATPLVTITPVDREANRNVIRYSPPSSLRRQQLVSRTMEVEAPGMLDFFLWDTKGNGFSDGSGWVNLWLGNRLIYSSGGDFGSELYVRINVL